MTTTINSVAPVGLNSANVRFDNSKDSERDFDLSANVDISNNADHGFNGEVYKDGMYMARFNCYNATETINSLSIDYQDVEASRQGAVLDAVQKFILAVRRFVSENNAVSLFE